MSAFNHQLCMEKLLTIHSGVLSADLKNNLSTEEKYLSDMNNYCCTY